MHADILPHVIFSPGKLALELCSGLQDLGVTVTLYTPGPVNTSVKNVNADLSLFERELRLRGDTYLDLLKKHPFTFITLARQVQSELLATAFNAANQDEIDIVHVYTNEEDTALPFAKLCSKPVVFTHHDPYNFLVKYNSVFPKYAQLPWLSMSYAQRKGMPEQTNWLANIPHGIPKDELHFYNEPDGNYFVYIGRIIEPKGVHLAIKALRRYNKLTQSSAVLKIAGKHYAGHKKDSYWKECIEPQLDKGDIEYVGFIKTAKQKNKLLGNAQALIIPSIFEEPFGLVMIEALACGTPVIGLDSGAIPEVIEDGVSGYIVNKSYLPISTNPTSKGRSSIEVSEINEAAVAEELADKMSQIHSIDRAQCRQAFEKSYTTGRMCADHKSAYEQLIQSRDR